MRLLPKEFRVALLIVLPAVVTVSNLVAGCGQPSTTPSSPSPTVTQEAVPSSDLEQAREALATFFSLLNEHRYSEAIQRYGGSYDALRAWNPAVAQDDYVKLFENGCTQNGLECLRIRTVVQEEVVSPTEFKFVVEFMNGDGTLFARGPCCGATESEMPTQTQFQYTVRNVGNRFLVQDLPVYVP
jgi:hypothetical protein